MKRKPEAHRPKPEPPTAAAKNTQRPADHGGPRPASRGSSAILFWYMTRGFLVPFACCGGGLVALFVLGDVFDVLQDFLEARAPLGQAALYFALRQPANLVHVLPMSVLLAASFTTGQLVRHNELTAVRTAGVSMIRCFLPVRLIAIGLSLLSFWLSEYVVPSATSRSAALRDQLTEAPGGAGVHGMPLAFRNADGDRDWFFESFAVDGPQTGVLVKQFGLHDRALAWELRAEKAEYVAGKWIFTNGSRLRYESSDPLPSGPEERFASFSDDRLRETPTEILNSLRPADGLSVGAMRRLLAYHHNLPRNTRDVFLTTIWYRIAFPFACVVGALLGVALALTPQGGSALRGFASAMVIMALYHVFSQVFLMMGRQGMVSPLVGGVLPTLVFAAWGGWEVYRRR